MSKSIRVRTTPGGDDNYIRVKLDQDFDQLELLSLTIDQEEVYQNFCANHGVVAGRVDINSGFGLKNTKVSIFIPLSDSDEENDKITALYPYKFPSDKNSNGVRYNLLPRKQQHIDHTPTGTFPDKRQVLDNPTMIEVYDKYYKFTTRTNESGDYMFFGVPTGPQTIFIDIDISDIGFLSTRPYEMIAQGKPIEEFEDKFTFKSNNNLEKLPQIISTSTVIEVLPFWCDNLSQGEILGITRFDYSVTEYELIPTAIFMGSIFSDDEKDSLNKNCRPRKKMGRLNELITGEGKLEAITRTQSGDIVKYKDIDDKAIDENGNWAIQLPMSLRKLVTDEFGALIPSPDGEKGVASEADFRFRVSMNKTDTDKRQRTRAKLLVPNMTNNYKFNEYSSDELSVAQTAGEPIYKLNEQLSYVTDPTNIAFEDPTNEYNYLEDFFTFRWKKVYTVRQYIPRYQPNKRDKNKNFIGFKEISEGVGVNKIPFNRLFTKGNIIYTILCFLLTILGILVAFINSIIQVINFIISKICQLRIPFPCIKFDFDFTDCKLTEYKTQSQNCQKGFGPLNGDCSGGLYTGGAELCGPGWSTLSTTCGSVHPGTPDALGYNNCIPDVVLGVNTGFSQGTGRKKYRVILDDCVGDCAPKPSGWSGFSKKIGFNIPAITFCKCIKVLFKFEIIDICIIKSLCDTCSNDDEVLCSDGSGGCNGNCCSSCRDCDSNDCSQTADPGCNPDWASCPENCLKACCEKIKPIHLKCEEEGMSIKPVLWSTGENPTCGGSELTICKSCSGKFIAPISDWVACKLEKLATRLNMLDFEFYNDWMNGSLYFPLIKRKIKIKRARRVKKGKSLKNGQGQVKKDKFCDYDCDGGNNEADYQHPDKIELFEVVIKDGYPNFKKQKYVFEGCRVILPANRRIKSPEMYDTAQKALNSVIFRGQTVGTDKPCQFSLGDTGLGDGDDLPDTNKFIKIKTKKVGGPHGKPSYIKIENPDPSLNGMMDTWKNLGGHAHHRNKCKKNYLVERLEYTKDDFSDCEGFPSANTTGFGIDVTSDNEDAVSSFVETPCSPPNADSIGSSTCCLACQGQGTAACTRKSGCVCTGDYNEKDINRGLVKWQDGELYYASIIESSDESLNPNQGGSSFDNVYYKRNMLFPTNITELGSSVQCDIDEAPFLIGDLEPTTYNVSEEELASVGGDGTTSPLILLEKEAEINLRAYVDFACDGVRCMNVRASLVESQVGTELFDLDDDSLDLGSCEAYVDVDEDIRRYFCQRFSTFTPTANGNIITDMKVNYVRPGGSLGENYYETYKPEIATPDSAFAGASATIISDISEKSTVSSPGEIILDGSINDGNEMIPGDKCGYWNDLTNLETVKYFYGMDLHEAHSKNNLGEFPYSTSELNETNSFDVEVIADDNSGITPQSTQTPYFFYFGLVPGRTALHKMVGKFFADKIDKQTLGNITENPNPSYIPNNGDKTESTQAIIGSCIKTR
jgi:hypothetical protein